MNEYKKHLTKAGADLSMQAKVSSVQKTNYRIIGVHGEVKAEVTGKILFASESNLELPVVGDFVQVDYFDNNELAIINTVMPRQSLLKRKTAGKEVEFQPIAANIDVAFIVQAAEADFNPARIERYLVMINEAGIKPVIVISKTDLVLEEELLQIKNILDKRFSGTDKIYFSNHEKEKIDLVYGLLETGLTYCLLGSSGVGKTTLLNNLIGEKLFSTSEIREKDNRGRHTTTSRNLIELSNGSFLIDTPGMRELANFDSDTGLSTTFGEIDLLAQNCKFTDCTHTSETGCAVLNALETGLLEEDRYNNYLKLKKESEYYERSYLEKRQRDKEFGKMCKAVMKTKNKRK